MGDRTGTLVKPVDRLLLRGGRLLDPASGLDRVADMVVKKDVIETVGTVKSEGFKGKVMDCAGKVICPGLIDMHVHLREPGFEDRETIVTGCRAAMAGGFTAVCCMPNTHPPVDNRAQVEFIRERAGGLLVDVHPVAAVTVARKGEMLTEMGDLVDAGAVAFSDDGAPVATAALMRRALEYASMFGHPVIDHCEDLQMSGDGVMNEGSVSTLLGLKSIPTISEDIIAARDILIAEYTGGPLHIAHVSSAGTVRLIRDAKARGVSVTAETCPHYLVMTDEDVRTFDTNTKMKPPLRSRADQEALVTGLQDGTIDVIASDHAPHRIQDKQTEYDAAAFGIIGLETSLGLILTHLAGKNNMGLDRIVEKMAVLPRKILGLPETPLKEGAKANLTVIDPDIKWTVDRDSFLSKSRNCPFNGWALTGRSMAVINKGMIFSGSKIR